MGAPVFELGAGVDERVRTGLRVEKPLTLALGPIMGGNLRPGRWRSFQRSAFSYQLRRRGGVAEG